MRDYVKNILLALSFSVIGIIIGYVIGFTSGISFMINEAVGFLERHNIDFSLTGEEIIKLIIKYQTAIST